MWSIQAKSCSVEQYSPVAFNCIIYLPISIYLIKCGNTARYSWSCDWKAVCLESVATTSPGSEHFRRVAKDNKVHVRSAQHSSLNKIYRIIIFKRKIMLLCWSTLWLLKKAQNKGWSIRCVVIVFSCVLYILPSTKDYEIYCLCLYLFKRLVAVY